MPPTDLPERLRAEAESANFNCPCFTALNLRAACREGCCYRRDLAALLTEAAERLEGLHDDTSMTERQADRVEVMTALLREGLSYWPPTPHQPKNIQTLPAGVTTTCADCDESWPCWVSRALDALGGHDA